MAPLAARRRVPFLCSCKEKEPKESTPRSRLVSCASRPGRALAELAGG